MSDGTLDPQPVDGEVAVPLASSEAGLAAKASIPLSVGQQLRAAREAKGMSLQDVAKVLKLSVHQVVALEEDDWTHLPGNTIIRGFVRNYARLVKLDTEPLMSALSALQMPQQSPTLGLPAGSNTALPHAGKLERRDFATVFSGLVLVVLAMLAYFFMPQDFLQSKLTELMALIKGPEAIVAKEDGTNSNAAPLQLVPANGAGAAVAEPAVSTIPAAAPAGSELQKAQTPDSSSGLKLSFAQPSWVEIRDRSGQIIFSQLNPAGSQRDIEGQPPFALVIGNATNVTVQYKGKVIDLSLRSKDDVARLNLD
jgi:cytoskeleton protein RodZ